MDTFPYHLGLLGHILAFAGEHGLFTSFFDFQVEVNGDNRVFLEVLRRLKVLVWANLWGLQSLQDISWAFLNRLGQLLQKLDVVVFKLLLATLLSFRLSQEYVLIFVWSEVYLKLE